MTRTKKSTDWGLLSLMLALLAILQTCFRFKHLESVALPLLISSLVAIAAGIFCLCKQNKGRKPLAIVGIVISSILFMMSLLLLPGFLQVL